MYAQVPITGDGIAQGAVLASVLAGFGLAAATSVRDRAAVVAYFAAAMLMLLSTWAGLLALVAARAPPEPVLANGFFATLAAGALAFVAATVRDVAVVYGRAPVAWCLALAATGARLLNRRRLRPNTSSTRALRAERSSRPDPPARLTRPWCS